MAVSIIDGWKLEGQIPDFQRQLFATVAEMAAAPDRMFPDIYEANVIQTGERYRYNRANDLDPVLGRWRAVGGGASLPAAAYEGMFLASGANGTTRWSSADTTLDAASEAPIANATVAAALDEKLDASYDPTLANSILTVMDDGSVEPHQLAGETIEYENAAAPLADNTVKEALDLLIAKVFYEPLTIAADCSPAAGVQEIGAEITNLDINWTYSKEVAAQHLEVAGARVELGTADRTYSYATPFSSDTTFKVSGTDEAGATASKSLVFTFDKKVFVGAAPIPADLDAAYIEGLGQQAWSKKYAGNYALNVGANDYIVVATPATLNIEYFYYSGFPTTLEEIGRFQYTNAHNHTEEYVVKRSVQKGLGSLTIELK